MNRPATGSDVCEHAGAQHPRKKHRSRTGCWTCRARKVKCDERPGICENCERLSIPCKSADTGTKTSSDEPLSSTGATSTALTEAGLNRRRTYRSCTSCRASKSRCSGDKPSCVRCSRKRKRCVYENDRDPAWTKVVGASSQQDDSSPVQRVRKGSVQSIGHHEHRSTADQEDVVELRETSADGSGLDQASLPNTREERTPSLEWLTSPVLPKGEKLAAVIHEYFSNIHPLRCFGFIHKPSFMQQVDDGLAKDEKPSALLLAVCALGAKFHALKSSHSIQRVSADFVRSAGNEWAKKALSTILSNLGDISVEKTMATVLLHDHELRIGNFASAFMLSSLSARMAQALQINLEYSPDILCTGSGPSASAKEARRRLMWSCYIIDSWVGSGVDQLTLVNIHDLKIQLPCDERNFLLQVPSITEMLEPGQFLRFVPTSLQALSGATNLGMAAYFIRIVELRQRVLRYVKHLTETRPPWESDSEFARLDTAFHHWFTTLPPNLHFNRSVLYMRKESLELGALCMFHITYHSAMCDFYRIGMPKLFRLRSPIRFPPEQHAFLQNVQDRCFNHAKAVANVFAEVEAHHAWTLADQWLPTVAYDSSRVMVYYITQIVGLRAENSQDIWKETALHLQANLRAQRSMIPMYSMSQPLYEAAASMLRKAGFDLKPVSDQPGSENVLLPGEGEMPSVPGTPSLTTPEYVLNPLSIYRMARSSVHEKHAPDKTLSDTSPLATVTDAATESYSGSPNVSVSYVSPRSQMDVSAIIESPPAPQPASFSEIDNFFNVGLDYPWQPTQTMFGVEPAAAMGMPPWALDWGLDFQTTVPNEVMGNPGQQQAQFESAPPGHAGQALFPWSTGAG